MQQIKPSSHSQVVMYETARDLVNGMIAECTAQIGDEERKANPDGARIEALENRMLELSREIDALDVSDHAGVMALIAKHRRPPYSAVMPVAPAA